MKEQKKMVSVHTCLFEFVHFNRTVAGIMLTSLIFLGIVFLKVAAERQSSVDENMKYKITVGLHKQKPVMLLNQNRVLKSLDLSIIENFGQKFNLQVDFLNVNKSVLKYATIWFLSFY